MNLRPSWHDPSKPPTAFDEGVETAVTLTLGAVALLVLGFATYVWGIVGLGVALVAVQIVRAVLALE